MEHISFWKVIFLGIIQGLTEFLPVSSSAHLVIFQQWLGLSKEGSFLLALDVALHFGTLAAVIVVFYRDLLGIGNAVFKPASENKSARKLGLYLILATIPAAVIGIIFKDFFEVLFADTIPASFFLLITGGILWLTKWVQPTNLGLDTMKQSQAWLIGLAQAVAIFPGISRSGTTIAMGLFSKLSPVAAVRFSFMLAIPAIGGATLLELPHLSHLPLSTIWIVCFGVLTSFAVGTAAIRWMLKIIGQQQLYVFSWYCWAVGGFVLVKELFL